MIVNTFGFSAMKTPILSYTLGKDSPHILILGGIHGDEIEGVIAATGVLEKLMHHNPFSMKITIVPQTNVDGVLNKTRGNGNGVDLNRNLPTKDWSPEIKTPRYHPGPSAGSEPENQALMKWIETEKPHFILSLHSWHPVLNVNGDCYEFAKSIQKATGYKIDDDIGYPTPGCLGTYTGLERNIPTLTYEIERGLLAPEIMKIHVPAIIEALSVYERKTV